MTRRSLFASLLGLIVPHGRDQLNQEPQDIKVFVERSDSETEVVFEITFEG